MPNTKAGIIRCGPHFLIINHIVTSNIAGFIILSICCSRVSKKISELLHRIFDHLFIKNICLLIQMKNYIKNRKKYFLSLGFYEQRNYISNCQRMLLIICRLVCFEICKITYSFLNNEEFSQQLMKYIITYIFKAEWNKAKTHCYLFMPQT